MIVSRVLGPLLIVLLAGTIPRSACAELSDAIVAFDRGDFGAAVSELEPLARQGNACGAAVLATMHALGLGVPQDAAVAAEWARRAAAAGDLAILAALLGLNQANLLGEMPELDEWRRMAVDNAAQGAAAGDPFARWNLGSFYLEGIGVERDETNGVQLIRMAAEAGLAGAQYDMGQIFSSGRGVVEDGKEASNWFRLAAEQGHVEAQRELGLSYRYGKSTTADVSQAQLWLKRAAAQDDPEAQNELGTMFQHGAGVVQNYREAANWYRRAAEQGDGWAQGNLARLYADGKGVEKNNVLAHMWFNLASIRDDIGFIGAAKARDKLEKAMTTEEVNEAQNLASKWKPKPRFRVRALFGEPPYSPCE